MSMSVAHGVADAALQGSYLVIRESMALRHLERDFFGSPKTELGGWNGGLGFFDEAGGGRASRMLSVEIPLETQVSFLVS